MIISTTTNACTCIHDICLIKSLTVSPRQERLLIIKSFLSETNCNPANSISNLYQFIALTVKLCDYINAGDKKDDSESRTSTLI